jgi:acyl-CoA synthetase (AMP-forming)/AMP-acid ligase II
MRPDPLFAALQHHAVQCPTALALSDSQRQVDYAQLWREVEARAEQLRALQVPLLALALNNGCEALIWDLAALRAGRRLRRAARPLPGAERCHPGAGRRAVRRGAGAAGLRLRRRVLAA